MKYYLENEYLALTFDTLGATLTSIKNPLGLEYLWQGDPKYWSSQAPVLFPICGSLREDKAITHDGQKIRHPPSWEWFARWNSSSQTKIGT